MFVLPKLLSDVQIWTSLIIVFTLPVCMKGLMNRFEDHPVSLQESA